MNQSATVAIDRPAAEVFAYVMEISHDAQWRFGIVEASYTTDGPIGLGTSGFDRISSNPGDMIAAWTTVEYVPGVLARWKFDSGPLEGSGGYVCEQVGDGTQFTLEAQVRSTGRLRFLGPVFGMVVKRLNRGDVRRLKTILEGQS